MPFFLFKTGRDTRGRARRAKERIHLSKLIPAFFCFINSYILYDFKVWVL